jgi:TolB protein
MKNNKWNKWRLSTFVIIVTALAIIGLLGIASATVTVEKIEFLTDTPEFEETPVWTADGSKIMYTFQKTVWNDRDSYIMNSDGTDKIRTGIGEGNLVGFEDLSPDGTELLITKSLGYWFDLYKVNINDGTETPIAADSSMIETAGSWSPDGTKITYTQGYPYGLWIIDSGGSNKLRLGTSDNAEENDWSPDGSKIIYAAGDTFPYPYDLWMINEDGSNQIQLTNTPYTERWPTFSPDGKYIVYASDEGGSYGLWIRNLDGTYKIKLIDVVDGDAAPDWNPDGKRIVFVGRNNGNLDVAVITLSFDDEGPVTSNVIASPNPAEMDNNLILNALVDDTTTGGSDIVSAEYSLDGGVNWNSMNAQDDLFNSPTELVTATFSISDPNVYDLCVRGTDSSGNIGLEKCTLLVVYDPNGMAAGGGLYNPLDDDETSMPGTASFGFITKIKDSSATGNLEFQYHVEDKLNLKSTSITWLVVSGSNAQFKGTATLNGEPGYYFKVIAKDNGELEDSDWFSIKIWNGNSDTESSTLVHSSHNTLAGGNIKVRTK